MKFRIVMVLLLAGALALTYYLFGARSTQPQQNPGTADPGIKLQQ
jgi:hypothetical protein